MEFPSKISSSKYYSKTFSILKKIILYPFIHICLSSEIGKYSGYELFLSMEAALKSVLMLPWLMVYYLSGKVLG